MDNVFRCQCKKIVCQIEGDVIIIKCRHCKRYIHINTAGIKSVEFKLTSQVNGRDSQVIHLRS